MDRESCIIVYHGYKTDWSPTVGELECEQELSNTMDPYVETTILLSSRGVVGHSEKDVASFI